MAFAIPPPDPIKIGSQLEESWEEYKDDLDIYLQATGQDALDSKQKAGLLLAYVGREAKQLISNWNFPIAIKHDFDQLIAAIDGKVKPKPYPIVNRLLFRQRLRRTGEEIEDYYTELKKLCEGCDFSEVEREHMMIDNIVDSIQDYDLKKMIMKDVSIEKAETVIDKIKEHEKLREASNQLTDKNGRSVHHIKYQPHQRNYQRNYHQYRRSNSRYNSRSKFRSRSRDRSRSRSHSVSSDHRRSHSKSRSRSKSPWKRNSSPAPESFKKKPCRRCDTRHPFGQCPAQGARCQNCGGLNHFTKSCKPPTKINSISSKAYSRYSRNSSERDSSFNLIHNIKQRRCKGWFEVLEVCNIPVNFKLDPGSEVNTLPLSFIKKLNIKPDDIHPTEQAFAYTDVAIETLGIVSLPVRCRGIKTNLEFVIIKKFDVPVLSVETCENLNLAQRVPHPNAVHAISNPKRDQPKDQGESKFLQENSDLFNNDGTFPDVVSLMIDDKKPCTRKPSRRYPGTIMGRLKSSIKTLEDLAVLAKAERPTSWVSCMLVREKPDGSLRICMDPQDLNEAIKRPFFEIPSAKTIQEKLCNNAYFTVLDLKNGFWHCKLDEASSNACVMSTPFGCYKWLRLPFGLNAAPEIFQQAVDKIFGDLPNVFYYFDDIIAYGKTEEEHDRALASLLQRARECNVKFNSRKIQLRTTSVKYVGQIFSKEGRRIDPDRVKAIQALSSPKNAKHLSKILGMFNYEREYIPNLANELEVVRPLLQRNNHWMWLECHDLALNRIKTLITEAPILANFDEEKPITIQCDASKTGIGFCLLQENRPVAYGSRTLTPTEQGYAVIEKEALAMLYATKKTHYYIYGREVLVETDHKPLVPIFKKNIAQIGSTRLQSLRIKMMIYNLNVQYRPGSKMHIADLLSRDPLAHKEEDEVLLNNVIHSITALTPVADPVKEKIRQATQQDPELQELIRYVQQGWPVSRNKLPEYLRHYWQHREEIHQDSGLLFFGHRIIIPKKLRQEMLNKIHQGHLGISKMQSLAVQTMYWPKLYEEITSITSSCKSCLKHHPKKTKEPMVERMMPTRAWQHLATDILDYQGVNYLVVVDTYSKWLEVLKLKDKKSKEIVLHLTELFARFGVPDIVYADNNPFNSEECRAFATEMSFQFVFSSPNYPQSNGQAEKAVHVAKSIIKKSLEGKTSIPLGLLNYRNMEIRGLDATPSQLLFSRRQKTTLPIHEQNLQPEIQENIHEKLLQNQKKYGEYYNRTAKRNKSVTFKDNQEVYVRHGETWQPAAVVKKNSTPRSYVVRKDGRDLVRTNRHMLPIISRIPLEFTQQDNTTNPETRRENTKKRKKTSPTPEELRRSKRIRFPNRKYQQ